MQNRQRGAKDGCFAYISDDSKSSGNAEKTKGYNFYYIDIFLCGQLQFHLNVQQK